MPEQALAPRPKSARGPRAHAPHAAQAPPRCAARRPRVAVVDRHALVAEAIGLSLAGIFEATPVPLQSCTTTAAARDAILRSRADVVILSLSPGGMIDTIALVEQVSRHGVSVLVCGDHLHLEDARRYLGAGATTFWNTGGVADVVRAVWREAERRDRQPSGGPPRPCDTPRPAERGHDPRGALAALTPAEAKILWALMQGRSADVIARDHVVSIATVRTQIKQVLSKLGAKSQLSAVALAWRADWAPHETVGGP
ncbi:helix-turn-helix transcriptional regulator [Nocardioides conyzicola]|uniref:Response regulator transcription factor n=1 Tax=Nocardioides conyzicola TaxID=1651781 RepID=A0ABP8XQ22_9ACTN